MENDPVGFRESRWIIKRPDCLSAMTSYWGFTDILGEGCRMHLLSQSQLKYSDLVFWISGT